MPKNSRKNRAAAADVKSECRINAECAQPVDLRACIEDQKCEPEFCRTYDEMKSVRAFAHKIVELRRKKKLSRAELARLASVSPAALNRLEKPESVSINLVTARKVISALGAKLIIDIEE